MEIIYLAITVVSLLAAVLAVRSKQLWAKKYRDAIDEATKSAPSTEEPEPLKLELTPDNLMKQYEMMVDVYKFHFEIVLKFIIFYYAVTGAIVSFYLSQPNTGFMYYALLLPIFMGFVFSIFAFFGAQEVDPIRKHIADVARALRLKPFPNEDLLKRLKIMLVVTSALSSGIALCLIWVTIYR